MKIWLITQDKNYGYDTFDSCVVVAETEDEAKKIVPGVSNYTTVQRAREIFWADPEYVSVTHLGEYMGEPIEDPIVCASFNAG